MPDMVTSVRWRDLDLEGVTMLDEQDLAHLRRCVALAEHALTIGDEPFGSVLVAADGSVLFEDHNRVSSGDRTRHHRGRPGPRTHRRDPVTAFQIPR